MVNGNDLYYDTDDAVKFIKEETGFDEDEISSVLESELRYMKSIGIIEEDI